MTLLLGLLFYGRPLVGRLNDWFHVQTDLWQTTIVIALVTLLGGAFSTVLTHWFTERKKRLERPFPYKLLEPGEDDLYLCLAIQRDRLETYISRNQLIQRWGADLIPSNDKIILHGRSGVGKSREAIEVINRISRISRQEKYQIAYKEYEATAPSQRPPDLKPRNVFLFIDDFVLQRGIDAGQGYEEIAQLKSSIKFFQKECDPPFTIVITMKTPQFETLKSSAPGFVDEFEVVQLEEMQILEKRAYINEAASRHKCQTFDESLYDLFLDKSLDYTTSFFADLGEERKRYFDREDVRVYAEKTQKEFHRNLKSEQRLILQTLSCLRQFGITATVPLVKQMFRRNYPKRIFFRSDIYFGKGFKYLLNDCLTQSENVIHAKEYRLTLKSLEDPSIKEDLLNLTDAALELCKPSFLQRRKLPVAEAVELLNMITRRLNVYREYRRALEVASVALKLVPSDVRALSQTGLTLRHLGKAREGQRWLQRALSVEPGNVYVSHQMARFLYKQKAYDEALNVLENALEKNHDDLLVPSLKLQILSHIHAPLTRQITAYRELRRNIRRGDAEIRQKVSAELTCVRFLAVYQNSAKTWQRLGRAALRIRTLVERVPESNNDRFIDYYELGRIFGKYGQVEHAIRFFQTAFRINPSHMASAQKLSSTFLRLAEQNEKASARYLEQARHYHEEAVRLEPNNYHEHLIGARIRSRAIDWDRISPEEFWPERGKVASQFEAAVEPNKDSETLFHNLKVYRAAASFEWHVENVARKRNLTVPPDYDRAEKWFRRGLELEKELGDSPTERLRTQFALCHFALAEYKLFTKSGIGDTREVRHHLRKAFELSNQGAYVNFESSYSYVECYIGDLYLRSGNLDKANVHLGKSLRLWQDNSRALWLLGKLAEFDRKFPEALAYYERSADIQQNPAVFRRILDTRKHLIEGGILEQNYDEDKRLIEKGYNARTLRARA